MHTKCGPTENFQLSPERLKDSGAYSLDNVRFICAELNTGKTKGMKDTVDQSGTNSRNILKDLMESTIQKRKINEILEPRYYTEEEIENLIENKIFI